jgi:hypothetical protein
MLYIGFTAELPANLSDHVEKQEAPMTYMDVVYRYGAVPGETELRAIDGVREVYGIRCVWFNDAERTVRVGYDGSRLKADAVAKLLRQAGIDILDRLVLAQTPNTKRLGELASS